jgi:hypothetical protein
MVCFASLNAQLMNNGGFESQDGVAPPGVPSFSIEYATDWHDLSGTCDLVPLITGTTRTGTGAGRLGVAPNGWTEFCLGSTQPLIAGHIYEVSFWIRKDYQPTNGTDLTYGLSISPTVPVITTFPLTSSVPPLMLVKVETTQYVKAVGCFTASENGAHYVAIGPFGGNGVQESVLCLIDDVEVIDITNQAMPTASIAPPQALYCVGDQILLDGSGSTNETSYEWKLFVNGQQEVYSSGIVNGEVGVFDATNHLSFMQPGMCYTAQLTTYGACKDVTTVAFCFDDPRFSFITPNTPVCENVPMQLEVTGDNGWTYAWSSGQSGLGLKNVTVTPSAPSASYTVTSTTPAGCSYSQTLNLTVHSGNNVAPTMNGIDGNINSYTYYVNEGGSVNFTSTIFNNAGETVTTTYPLGIPSGFNVNAPNPSQNGGTVTITGQTTYTMAGTYDIVLNLADNNTCGALTNTYTFHIVVVCKTCPICYDLENRTPTNDPLLPEYKMAQCILAGITEPVIVGEGNEVTFQAGAFVDLGTFFDTDGGICNVIIEPTTCLDDCYDCCTDWNGFTYDEIPNPVILITVDDDPTNDYFELFDSQHPFCAFGAVGYKLAIYDVSPISLTCYQEYSTDECCSFQSPSPEIPWLAHSEIWWDNFICSGTGQGTFATQGNFYYELTLIACNGQEEIKTGYIDLNNPLFIGSGLAQQPDNTEMSAAQQQFQQEVMAQAALNEQLNNTVSLTPNPATDKITIQGIDEGKVDVQVFDAKGNVVIGRHTLNSLEVSISKLSAGTYYCKIFANNAYISKKFVKQ